MSIKKIIIPADLINFRTSFMGASLMSGTVDGSNKTFTYPSEFIAGTVTVFVGRNPLASSEYTTSFTSGITTVVIGANVEAPNTSEDVLISGFIGITNLPA